MREPAAVADVESADDSASDNTTPDKKSSGHFGDLTEDARGFSRELGVKAKGQRRPAAVAPFTPDARPTPVTHYRPASPFASPPSD